MSDVERVDPPEPTPVETPPEPHVEAVDSEGVPFKNRAEEYRRKYEQEQELNRRYMEELGRRQTAPPPPPPQQTSGEYEIEVDGQKHKFDRASVELIRRLSREESNQTAQAFVGRSQLAQEVSDPEIRAEAEKVYREEVLSSPWYSQWNDDAKQAVAIKEAKSRVVQRRYDALKKGTVTQSQAQASQAQAQSASLPGTGGASQTSGDKDRYVKEFMNDPQQRSYLRSMWKLDPDSAEGQAKLKRTAEFAWKGSPVSEKFTQGIELLRKGGQ